MTGNPFWLNQVAVGIERWRLLLNENGQELPLNQRRLPEISQQSGKASRKCAIFPICRQLRPVNTEFSWLTDPNRAKLDAGAGFEPTTFRL